MLMSVSASPPPLSFPLPPPQSNYYECAVLILRQFPEQLDLLLSLVFSEKIEESKMKALMEHISKHSPTLLLRIMAQLASNTSAAGMELLR